MRVTPFGGNKGFDSLANCLSLGPAVSLLRRRIPKNDAPVHVVDQRRLPQVANEDCQAVAGDRQPLRLGILALELVDAA